MVATSASRGVVAGRSLLVTVEAAMPPSKEASFIHRGVVVSGGVFGQTQLPAWFKGRRRRVTVPVVAGGPPALRPGQAGRLQLRVWYPLLNRAQLPTAITVPATKRTTGAAVVTGRHA